MDVKNDIDDAVLEPEIAALTDQPDVYARRVWVGGNPNVGAPNRYGWCISFSGGPTTPEQKKLLKGRGFRFGSRRWWREDWSPAALPLDR